jgi:hypothetical protein
MFTNNTTQDDDHEQLATPSELDPLVQRDEKGPSKKEERVARAQFLALCFALFVVGWTDGSTGPLLPRIQIFYDVSWVGPYPFDLFFFPQPPMNFAGGIRNSVLGIRFAMYGQCCLLGRYKLS